MVGNHPGGTAISVAGAAGHRKGVCLLDEFHLGTFFAIAPAECDWAPGCLTIYIYILYIFITPQKIEKLETLEIMKETPPMTSWKYFWACFGQLYTICAIFTRHGIG